MLIETQYGADKLKSIRSTSSLPFPTYRWNLSGLRLGKQKKRYQPYLRNSRVKGKGFSTDNPMGTIKLILGLDNFAID